MLRQVDYQCQQPADASADDKARTFHAVAAVESAKASRYYDEAVRDQIESPRCFDRVARASRSRHEEVLVGLIRLGTTFLQTA